MAELYTQADLYKKQSVEPIKSLQVCDLILKLRALYKFNISVDSLQIAVPLGASESISSGRQEYNSVTPLDQRWNGATRATTQQFIIECI